MEEKERLRESFSMGDGELRSTKKRGRKQEARGGRECWIERRKRRLMGLGQKGFYRSDWKREREKGRGGEISVSLGYWNETYEEQPPLLLTHTTAIFPFLSLFLSSSPIIYLFIIIMFHCFFYKKKCTRTPIKIVSGAATVWFGLLGFLLDFPSLLNFQIRVLWAFQKPPTPHVWSLWYLGLELPVYCQFIRYSKTWKGST